MSYYFTPSNAISYHPGSCCIIQHHYKPLCVIQRHSAPTHSIQHHLTQFPMSRTIKHHCRHSRAISHYSSPFSTIMRHSTSSSIILHHHAPFDPISFCLPSNMAMSPFHPGTNKPIYRKIRELINLANKQSTIHPLTIYINPVACDAALFPKLTTTTPSHSSSMKSKKAQICDHSHL